MAAGYDKWGGGEVYKYRDCHIKFENSFIPLLLIGFGRENPVVN
jgi:hypothetical protein